MSWRDLGLVCPIVKRSPWMASHAYVPTIFDRGAVLRIFCAFWDDYRVGRIGYIDIDKNEPEKVLSISGAPVMKLGEEGSFDANGQTPLSIVCTSDRVIRLYYAGWKTDERLRYRLFTGLAFSYDQGETFIKHGREPVIGPTVAHPQVRTGGMVMNEGGRYRTWFAESVGSIVRSGVVVPTYQLSHMVSDDGIVWPDSAMPCFSVVPGSIFGYGRSAIWRDSSGFFRGLFSVRREQLGYTIGYSVSADGIVWNKIDFKGQMAFSPSSCIDQEQEVMFPSLYHFSDGRILMAYNGLGYGMQGLRLAIWGE